ncbi:MAG: hypothetical protein HOP18_26920 [Deltaproteobacteria bacterium]|nr:hypothetical protein [Deltaproteobacteria bacterium]
MWTRKVRFLLGKTLLIVVLLFLNACSAQKSAMDDAFLVEGKDPFEDPFFADSPKWDSKVLEQSELLSATEPTKEWEEQVKQMEEPKTFQEKAEEALFSTALVGGIVAKMIFLPFLGF